MLNIIKDTYKLYFKKLPLLALFVIPLILYSLADSYLRKLTYTAGEFQALIIASLILSTLVYTATQVALYKYLMSVKIGGIFSFIKKWALFVAIHLVMGWVMMFPVFLFKYILGSLDFFWILIAIVANIFFGLWIFARVNVALPMIIKGEKLSPKKVWRFGKQGYLPWLQVSALVYFPFVVAYYLIPNEVAQMVLASLLSVVSCIFNSLYYKNKK